MGRPSPLHQRWKTQKARARRSGYWGRGLMKGPQRGPFLADNDVFAASKHASSKRNADLSRLFDLSMDTNWMKLGKRIGPELAKAGWRAVEELFLSTPIGKNLDIDPKMEIFQKQQMIYMLNHDPKFRYLRFNFIYINGAEDDPFNLTLHFQGKEFFLVEKRINYLRRSSIYSDKDRMMDLFHLGRIQWASKVPLT